MEAANSHGFHPGTAASAAPVLDVAPLRAVAPTIPPPGPPGCPPFIYVSPFSPLAIQFAAARFNFTNPHVSDPAEAQRKQEQDNACEEKWAERSAVHNFLKTCVKNNNDNSVGNGEQPCENSAGQSGVGPLDGRKKPGPKAKQGVPKSEVFDDVDCFNTPKNLNSKTPKTPPSAKGKNLVTEETPYGTGSSSAKGKNLGAEEAQYGTGSSSAKGKNLGAEEAQYGTGPSSAKGKNLGAEEAQDGTRSSSGKEKNLGAEEAQYGARSSNGKKRKKGSEQRPNRSTKGTTVFRAREGDPQSSAALDRKMVRRALMIYDSVRRKLVQDDEARKGPPVSGSCKRPDLKAGTVMMDRGLCVNRERRIVGAVPGVNVGDLFYFRMELCVVGVHGPVMAGIDYINAKCNQWSEPVATSIISSGGYEDDVDDGETLIYTGQGGNNYMTDRKQTDDQKLERGNLALERSMHHGIEVRVIRGIKDTASPSGKTYVYDGLYKVQESWLDKGRSGFSVFKYKLMRIPGQPELGSALLKATRQWKSQPSARQGLLLLDISSRNEIVPICVVNNVDNDKGPAFFEYIRKVKYSFSVDKLEPSQGCDCKGGCAPGDKCSCISLNGGEMAYISNGTLAKWKPIVYECGDQCRCPPSCRNRVSQKGLKNQLEVFKTNSRGWGVCSWDPIPAGSFVCEYSGEVLSDSDTEQEDEDNDYLLCANHTQENQMDCSVISDILSVGTSSTPPVQFCSAIDASRMGNVSRFMNHSCSPNLFRQAVLYDHHDAQFPHIMLFAMENIPPLTELTLDYGVRASHGRKGAGKSKVCLCGASDCRGEFF